MMAVHGSRTVVELLSDGKRIHIASGEPLEVIEGVVDISSACRAVTIRIAANDINMADIESVGPKANAVLEVVGPSVDVLAQLQEVRVVHFQECPTCGAKTKTDE